MMLSVFLQRITKYEYWPFWLFYFPAYFYGIYLSIKARSLVYFTILNPCMNLGGTFMSSKYSYLKELPNQWIPKSLIVKKNDSVNDIKNRLSLQRIHFPIIAKPDFGERGKDVAKIECVDELKNYFLHTKYQTILLQEFIDYPIELGILFYWDTDGVGRISSIGVKNFCVIKGDGKHTFGQLVSRNPRIAKRKKKLRDKFQDLWDSVLHPTQEILVEPIGNHNRGTKFLDGNYRYTKEMLEWVKETVSHISEFDYGRLDLRIKDWDSFKRKEGIKVLEINGVNSEPIHIYDPTYGIIKAYKDIFKHMGIINRLSIHKMNKQKPASFRHFLRGTMDYIRKNEPQKQLAST